MKPLFLEFCGINSFSEPATINFSSLLEYGIFGIFGDTGSGKSTILDCIGFALYGTTARSRAGKIADIINDKRDSAYVRFEFEIVYEGKRRIFRVERELKRKGTPPHSARVYEREGDALHALSEGVKECEDLLRKIIGLDQKDFDRCIALPQGEFAQFVKSPRAERLKLVSRLFDLEAYGDKLNARAKRKLEEARLEEVGVSSRLATYEDVTKERLAETEGEMVRRKEEEKTLHARLEAAAAEEKELTSLFIIRKQQEETRRKLETLEAQRQQFSELEQELSRLAAAGEVVRQYEDGKALRAALQGEKEALEGSQTSLKRAEEEYSAISAWDEAATDAAIESLSARRQQAIGASDIRTEKKKAEERLAKLTEDLQRGLSEFRNFDYDGERERLEHELSALGSENFSEYLDAAGKDSLFRAEYATFTHELEWVRSRHEDAAEDLSPLIEKYRALATGPNADLAALRAAFEAAAPRRRELGGALRMLEKRKGQYEEFLAGTARATSEREELSARLKEYDKKLADVPDLAETDRLLAEQKKIKRENAEKRQHLFEELHTARIREATARERETAAERELESCKARYRKALEGGGFEDFSEAQALTEKFGDAQAAKARLDAFRIELSATQKRRDELSQTDCSRATEEAVAAAEAEKKRLEAEERETGKALAVLENARSSLQRRLAEKEVLERECEKAQARRNLFESLKKLLDNNKFMEFVAEEYLETVALNASARLLSLTGGRYFLRYEGGFFVGDNFNGGERRAVFTLSGGETFLVSLSLALALGTEICKRSLRPIEFFFLDEGFGTLDSNLVDTVTDSLEKLRSENFSIGIISHVEELKHRIDRKLTVVKATQQHGSQILS